MAMRTITFTLLATMLVDIRSVSAFLTSSCRPVSATRIYSMGRCGQKGIRSVQRLPLRCQQQSGGEDDPTKGDWDEYDADKKRFAYNNKGGADDDQVPNAYS
jgi:hypothetical protein